jgi:septal ring factor EnvC (AmiA/AmiB activator)
MTDKVKPKDSDVVTYGMLRDEFEEFEKRILSQVADMFQEFANAISVEVMKNRQEIKELRLELMKTNQRVSALEAGQKALSEDIGKLKAEIKQIKQDIKSVKSDVKAIRQDVNLSVRRQASIDERQLLDHKKLVIHDKEIAKLWKTFA